MFKEDFLMPIGEVSDDGLIASQTGSITAALEIIHAGCHQPAETYESLNRTMVKANELLPDRVIVVQQDRFLHRRWEPPAGHAPSFLAHASDAHFTGRPYFDHKTYFFITLPPRGSRPATWDTALLFRRHLVPGTLLDEELKRTFHEAVAQFEYVLRSSKLCEIRRLTAGELKG